MIDQLIQLVTYLVFVSVAAERATDMLKRSVIQDKFKNLNGAVYQFIAFGFGFLTATISSPTLPVIGENIYLNHAIIGLCVSGGSGFWNTILELLKNAKSTMAIPEVPDVKTEQK